MDIIQQVVKTEAEQIALLAKAEADFKKKISKKSNELADKFTAQKQVIVDAHNVAFAKLKKSFIKKQSTLKNPSYSLSSEQMKTVVKDVMKQVKWQLKK